MTKLETIVIDWMTRKGPPEWHGVAAHWNWDNGIEPLLWVLDQEDCDQGTALSVFWACDPYDQMDERQAQCRPGREDYQIVHKVLERWIPAECHIAFIESEGEAASDFDRKLLAEEQSGLNMSQTDAEAAAQHEREVKESLTDLEDFLEEVERMRRTGQG